MAVINYLITPSGFIAICLVLGLVTSFHGRISRLSPVFFIIGSIVYLLLSIGPVSYALLKPLEFQYNAYDAEVQDDEVAFIVVMSGYALDESYYLVSSKVNCASLFRLVEANRLWRLDPDRRIIISGKDDGPRIMQAVLEDMGVSKERIIIDNQSVHTYNSAQNISKLFPGKRFFLVTSAGHMPRTMAAFHKLGRTPIAAPTDYQVGKDPFKANFFPTVNHLYYSELAIHEFLGIWWYRFRGLI